MALPARLLSARNNVHRIASPGGEPRCLGGLRRPSLTAGCLGFPRSICCWAWCKIPHNAGGETQGGIGSSAVPSPGEAWVDEARQISTGRVRIFHRSEFGNGIAGCETTASRFAAFSKKLGPYAIAQKASKLHARIKEIQGGLQCPCPSKYRLKYYVDGAEVPGELVRDNERLAIFGKRRAEKKTFTAEEDLEEAIRTARYESFLVSPEIAAAKRVAELRQKKRVADTGGPPLSRAERVTLRFLGTALSATSTHY